MIGIFDSGLGGLLVFKEIKKVLPEYSYIYLGDTLRTPYGGRSKEAVYEFTKRAVDFLFAKGCRLIILACNTASSDALRKLQQEYSPLLKDKSKNILGVIIPLVETASVITRNKKIGVVGTRATINSGVYETELKKIDKNIQVFQTPCPLLVPLIEENWIKEPETEKILEKYLQNLKNTNIDTLILGCTHYPILYNTFKSIMGKDVNILNSGEVIAEKLVRYLSRHSEIDSRLEKNGITKYYATDITDSFKELSKRIIEENIEFEKIEI